jgi:hypothetical protein
LLSARRFEISSEASRAYSASDQPAPIVASGRKLTVGSTGACLALALLSAVPCTTGSIGRLNRLGRVSMQLGCPRV